MKAIKLSIIALIIACSFQVANAQVRVGIGINIGNPYPVVVHRPAPVVYAPPPVVYAPARVVYRRPVVYKRHYAPVRHKVIHPRPHHGRHW